MVKVTLVGYKIKSIDMCNNINTSGELRINHNFGFNVAFTNGNARSVALLTERVELEGKPEVMHFEMAVEGIFNVDGIHNEEEKKEAHVACYDALFPVAQLITKNIFDNSGMKNLMLQKMPLSVDDVAFSKKPN